MAHETTPGEPPLALTMGDPAGIGLDITLAAWTRSHHGAGKPFVLYADPDATRDRAASLGLGVPIEVLSGPDEARDAFARALPVVAVRSETRVTAGTPHRAHAPAVVDAIDRATADVIAGRAAALVTNPIAKSVLYDAGFAYPGHTEYLADLARRLTQGRPCTPVMMLVSEELRVVPLTIHMPLASVPRAITAPAIASTLSIMARALEHDFAIPRPRIAVTGLNPHAGEDGALGREEIEVIQPAIRAAAEAGLTVTGPYPADTMFHAEARTTYDAVLAMYHDQALVPIKTLAFDRGVNVTLGLPFVRTSPDHGTAFALAATGSARADSLIAALDLAATLAERRRLSPLGHRDTAT